jgi:RNA polymerase sigma factor (sigma-70 family)
MISCAVKKYIRPGSDEESDLVQEVFLALFGALKSYDPSRPVEAYILEIARRVRISMYRKDSALKRGGDNPGPSALNTHDSTHDEDCVSVPSPLDDPESSLIKAQEAHLLRNALNALSESCRELLALRYERELSYQEIGQRLEVKEGTLRVRLQRCLASLARKYAGLVPSAEGSP